MWPMRVKTFAYHPVARIVTQPRDTQQKMDGDILMGQMALTKGIGARVLGERLAAFDCAASLTIKLFDTA